jgi:hypothetical protein
MGIHDTKSESSEALCRRLARQGRSDEEIIAGLRQAYPEMSPGAISAHRKYLLMLRDRMADTEDRVTRGKFRRARTNS